MRHVWTERETEYLETAWGKTDPRTIARNLGVTVEQVRSKKTLLRLGPYSRGTDTMSAPAIYMAIRGGRCFMNPSVWLRKNGLRMQRRRNCTNTVWVADIREIWKWLDKHRGLPNWRRFRPGALGAEPAWAQEARRENEGNRHREPWTALEREKLRVELECGMTAEQIARAHGRTQEAARHVAAKLGKRRAASSDAGEWTREEIETARRMRDRGETPSAIAQALHRSLGGTYKRLQRLREGDTEGQKRWAERRWTKGEKMRAAGFYRAGYTIREIAGLLGNGRTRGAVRGALRALARDPICGWK